jgi:hypothetical protein
MAVKHHRDPADDEIPNPGLVESPENPFDLPEHGRSLASGPATPGTGTPARLNPFAAGRVEALEFRFPEGLDWSTLLERLEKFDFRAALVGPEGRGKTSLLEQLGERLEDRGFTARRATLRRGQRRLLRAERRRLLRELGPRDVLLIDGVQELSRWSWWRLRWRSRAAGGFVVTSHREGLLPTLLRCETSPELLEGLVAELLGTKNREELAALDLLALYECHGGNVREALWELYDRWAGRT